MASGFTFMMWLRFNDLTASRPAIHWGLGCTSDANFMQPFAGIHGGFQLGGSAPEPSAVGSVEDATQWHHYAQSWNATDGRRVVYVDGVEVSSDAAGDGATYIGGAFLDDDAFMYIGMNSYPRQWGLDEYTHGNPQMSFDGEIDDLAIYAGPLSNESIAARARLAGEDLLGDDCLFLYTFDDASQDVVTNLGRAGRNETANPYDLRFAQFPKPPGAEDLGRKFSRGSGTSAALLVAPSRIPSSRTNVSSDSAPSVVSALPGANVTVETADGPRQLTAPTDGSTLFEGGVHVVPRLPPTTERRDGFASERTFEDREVSLQLVGSSNFAPGIELKPVITSLPSNGALFATKDLLAGSEQGIAISESQQTVDTVGRYVRYKPADHFVGVDTFTYSLLAPGGVLSEESTTVRVEVESDNDMPTIAPIAKRISEDSGDLVIRLTPTDVEDGQPLELAIMQLPRLGDLYPYNETSGAAQDGPPITQVYSAFNVGEVFGQYISAVINSSSFWGNPPSIDYHPLAVIGKPDCGTYGECATSGEWVSDASRPIPPGVLAYHVVDGIKAAAHVRSSNEVAGTVEIDYVPMFKRDAGVLRRCLIDPGVKVDEGVSAYPGGCELVSDEPISKSVPRAQIVPLAAGVWSPLKQGLVDENLSDPDKSVAFGAQFLVDHRQRNYYPPYTEYIDVAIARPVYVVRLEIGSPRGMGQVVKILAQSPEGSWVEVYSGKPLREVAAKYTSMRTYHLWAPSICRTHFPVSVLRIAVDTSAETGIDDWNYIDYVEVFGSETLQPAAIRTTARAVVYRPHDNAVGEDSFRYGATDCPGDPFRTTESQLVSISIVAVNDAPKAVGVPVDVPVEFPLRGLVGASFYSMKARDVDRSDTFTFKIHTLPTHATLSDQYPHAAGEIGIGGVIPMAAAPVAGGEIPCSEAQPCPSSPITGSLLFCSVAFPPNGTCAWCDDVDDCDTSANLTIWSRGNCRTACRVPVSPPLVESAQVRIQSEVCGPDSFSFSVSDGVSTSAVATVHFVFQCSRRCDRADMLSETSDCDSSDPPVRRTTWRWDDASDCDLPRAGLRRPAPGEPAGVNVPATGRWALPASTTEECSSDDDSTSLIVVVCSVVGTVLLLGCCCAAFVVRRLHRQRHRLNQQFLCRRTHLPPDIAPVGADEFHLFLSHTWLSGQDQIAMIKQQLSGFLPAHVRVFRDVDDLENIDRLEEYVAKSQVVLLFLSKGYFLSRNCLREVRAAVTSSKPVILVHEHAEAKGGDRLEVLRQECPEDLRELVFDPKRPLVRWHRLSDLNRVSLLQIASLLHTFGRGVDQWSLNALYLPNSLTETTISVSQPVRIFASRDNNQGANRILDGIVAAAVPAAGPTSFIRPPTERKEGERRGRLAILGGGRRGGDRTTSTDVPHVEQHLSDVKLARNFGAVGASVRIQSAWRGFAARTELKPSDLRIHCSIERADSLSDATHMLLYLTLRTFDANRAGADALANEIREARKRGISLVMVHEQREGRDRCTFDHLRYTTPEDLERGGVYNDIAIPLFSSPMEQAVCIALAYRQIRDKTSTSASSKQRLGDNARVGDGAKFRLAGGVVGKVTGAVDDVIDASMRAVEDVIGHDRAGGGDVAGAGAASSSASTSPGTLRDSTLNSSSAIWKV